MQSRIANIKIMCFKLNVYNKVYMCLLLQILQGNETEFEEVFTCPPFSISTNHRRISVSF